MRAKESREMYLEVILKLEERNGIVRSIDIAKELNYSKPSVSRAMTVLKKENYITHSPYGDVSLTEEGRAKAESVYKSHRLLTEFLVKSVGLDWGIAEQDACKIEHVISQEALDAIEQYLSEN